MNYLELIKREMKKVMELHTPGGVYNFAVEIPDLEHGDVTSNVCLVASKILKKSPQEIFEVIRPHLASPWKGEEYSAKSSKYNGKKVLVEFTSVNLFKAFNIGHLMSNFTGEYISRSLESQGAKVVRISYPSDISIGIAKAIWIIKQDGGLNQEIFKKQEKEIVKYLGECYVRGVQTYKDLEALTPPNLPLERGGIVQEVKIIANNLYGQVASEDWEIYEFTKKVNVNYFKNMIESLGTKFDGLIYESEAGIVGKKIVEENIPNIFQKSEGAIIYTPSEDRKDINTSVFINSEGNPTYLAKDIGLLNLKFKKYPDLDYSIYVVDNEQNSHFKSVFDAGGKIHSEWEDKSIHVSHGRMTFKGQKMSSRLGGVPSGEEVIEAVYEDVLEKSKSSKRIDQTPPNLPLERGGTEHILKEIALSALRISILRSKPGVNIDFDPEKASSFEGDSGPYLCYTHARCCSLLEKGGTVPLLFIGGVRGGLPLEPHLTSPINRGGIVSTNIERKVLQFPNILKISAEEIAPQKLVKYLFELAGEFNNFYAHEKILSDDKEKTEQNLYLTKLVKETLNKGLYILGIEAPERM